MALTIRETKQLNIKEQETFLSLLHRDSRGGAILRVQLKDGEVVDNVASKELKDILYEGSSSDIYVSVNSMKMTRKLYANRKAANVFSVNAIYIDLDLPDHKKTEYSETVINDNLDTIHNAIKDGLLPQYTMLTSTGNGLGLFFVLKNSIANLSSTEKQLKYYDFIYTCLANRIEQVLKSCKTVAMTVDKSVVADHARICRLPGTKNSKSNTYCTLLQVNEAAVSSLSDIGKIVLMETKIKETKPSVIKKENNKEELSLSFHHAKMITRLQLLRDSRNVWNGHREVFCFIYYNTAKQCMDYQEAKNALYRFNETMGISENRIRSIIRTVDRNVARDGSYKGYYHLSNEWIRVKLDLTEEEVAKFGFNDGYSWEERNFRNHMNVVKKRLDTHKLVVNTLLNNEKITYADVEMITGVPVGTVKRIAKTYGCQTRDKEISNVNDIDWQQLYDDEVSLYNQKRLKICTSVVNNQRQVMSEQIDSFIDVESSVVNETFEFESIDVLPEGFTSVETSPFDALNNDNPFETSVMNPFVSDSTEDLSDVDILLKNQTYADSFLNYLKHYVTGSYQTILKEFLNVYESTQKNYLSLGNHKLSNKLAVLVCMIADKYKNQYCLEYSIHDLDNVYRFIMNNCTNIRDYEGRIRSIDVNNYIASNTEFVYTPYNESIDQMKPVVCSLNERELDKLDYHYLELADLLESDSYKFMLNQLDNLIESYQSDSSLHEQLVLFRQHIPTFGRTRLEHLLNAVDWSSCKMNSESLLMLFCGTLHCKQTNLGRIKGSYNKRRSRAQKAAASIRRSHNLMYQYCKDHRDISVCSYYLRIYNDTFQYENEMYIVNGTHILGSDLRKKILYRLTLEDLSKLDDSSVYNFLDSLGMFIQA